MLGAVDVGGTKIAIGLVSNTGQLLDSTSLPTRPGQPYDQSLQECAAVLETMLTAQGEQLHGIGVGMTGRMDPDGRLHANSFLPGWAGHTPAADLGLQFNISAAIENDADAAALAEYQWGCCAGAQRLIYVTISTGIGGGILLHGRLYRGVDGCHPEIGHQVISDTGPACFCGASGCWERMASGTALAAWARENGGNPAWDARAICDLAEAGHPLAGQAVAREARYLGIGLGNLITSFAPDCIILGGGLMQRWELFRAGVEATLASQCGLVPLSKIQLRVTTLQHAGLLGAAAAWIHRHGASK